MTTQGQKCSKKYWSSHRFAPEVIQSMDEVLNNIKQKDHIQKFNLIGFSGGAAVALLVASRRNDIASIRTVGGNLDHVKVNEIHNVSPMTESLNPRDIAKQINDIPQIHFLGEDDSVITPEVLHSYLQASGKTDCIQTETVEGVSHENGWGKVWPRLLSQPLNC